MKIGIFTPYLDTLTGGEKYILTAAACLSKDHDVSIFWDDRTILKKAEKKFGLHLSKVALEKNIFSSTTRFMNRLKQTKQYDAIIYLSDGSLPITLTKKLIIHFQFPMEWVNADTLGYKIKRTRIYKGFCNSEFTKYYIDKKFHIHSDVIYPPIDVPKIGNLTKANTILTVGRYGYLPTGGNFKKHDIMISAFKSMIDKGLRTWKFVIVISYFQRDRHHVHELKDLAKGYPIEFIENISSKDLQAYYEKARIYWHAAGFGEDLDVHPDYAEHFGMSTVEAMGYGAVPVVINAGGQKEIVDNGKNGFLWNTVDELTKATQRLITNDAFWKRLSKAAMKRPEEFSKERFCKEISELVQ